MQNFRWCFESTLHNRMWSLNGRSQSLKRPKAVNEFCFMTMSLSDQSGFFFFCGPGIFRNFPQNSENSYFLKCSKKPSNYGFTPQQRTHGQGKLLCIALRDTHNVFSLVISLRGTTVTMMKVNSIGTKILIIHHVEHLNDWFFFEWVKYWKPSFFLSNYYRKKHRK